MTTAENTLLDISFRNVKISFWKGFFLAGLTSVITAVGAYYGVKTDIAVLQTQLADIRDDVQELKSQKCNTAFVNHKNQNN